MGELSIKIILRPTNEYKTHVRANSEYNYQPNKNQQNERRMRSRTQQIGGFGSHSFGNDPQYNRKNTMMTYKDDDMGSPIIRKFDRKKIDNLNNDQYLFNYKR